MIKEFDIIDYFTSIEVLLRSTHPIDLAASTQRLGAKFSNNKITPHNSPFSPKTAYIRQNPSKYCQNMTQQFGPVIHFYSITN